MPVFSISKKNRLRRLGLRPKEKDKDKIAPLLFASLRNFHNSLMPPFLVPHTPAIAYL
jgi:hypothetical protein